MSSDRHQCQLESWVQHNSASAGTWGLVAEVALVARTTLTAEVFGQRGGDGFYQFGLKHWLIPDRVQVDMTYGQRLWRGDAARFVSAGLVLFSDVLR